MLSLPEASTSRGLAKLCLISTIVFSLSACGASSSGGAKPPPPGPHHPPHKLTYDVIPLSLGGDLFVPFVSNRGITPDGRVVGFTSVPDGPLHAFLYDGQKTIDLGTFGGPDSRAWAINKCGHVVGSAAINDSHKRAFLYDGVMRDLGTLVGPVRRRSTSVPVAKSPAGPTPRPGPSTHSCTRTA
ncbi:hypothetical protein [Massilia glaciei]|uniref:Uncharacterized protein n=1 Tax=Massilia glaciei TaxID=1524097 RepID=A0A2U2HG03_9BURK|nr:hypothetical protein [Massilia glaciei]PWF43637.1 hypothetical protein C7C56_020895 [Massilia glaciei]